MKKTNMLMLITVLLFSACKKSDTATVEPTTNCKIILIKEEDDPASTYTYDVNGKVSQVTNLYGFGDGVFSYQSGSIIFTDSDTGVKETFVTDASGYIISDDYDNYKYNSDGYVIEKTAKDRITPQFILSYTNGNLVKVTNGNREVTEISYYDSETNQNLLGYENAVWSNLLFNLSTFSNIQGTMIGKGSKNLVKSIVMKRTDNGKVLQFTNLYSYKKDQDGKVVTLTISSEAPSNYYNGIRNINFTYQCQ